MGVTYVAVQRQGAEKWIHLLFGNWSAACIVPGIHWHKTLPKNDTDENVTTTISSETMTTQQSNEQAQNEKVITNNKRPDHKQGVVVCIGKSLSDRDIPDKTMANKEATALLSQPPKIHLMKSAKCVKQHDDSVISHQQPIKPLWQCQRGSDSDETPHAKDMFYNLSALTESPGLTFDSLKGANFL